MLQHQMSMNLHDYLTDVRWIQYSPDLAKMLSPTGSILSCWVIFKSRECGGPVEATFEKIMEDTGLSERNIETARDRLQASGVLVVTTKRLEHKTFYAINPEALEAVWCAARESTKRPFERNGETARSESAKRPFGTSLRTVIKTKQRAAALDGLVPSPKSRPKGEAAQTPRSEAPPAEQPPLLVADDPEPEVSDFQRFKLGWVERFKRRTGEAYSFSGAKDGTAIKRLLTVGSAESLLALVDRCDAAPDDSAHWNCKAGLSEIAKFSSFLNGIRTELAPKVARRAEQREGNGANGNDQSCLKIGRLTFTRSAGPVRSQFRAGEEGDGQFSSYTAAWKQWAEGR